jgi:tetratricopeptide (TPR) repeat protein
MEAAVLAGLTPLVGREPEVRLLLERWAQVQEGQGQVVLVSGEAGIGKSRLVQVLKDYVAGVPHVWWECRGSPSHQHTAFYPLTDLWQRALHFQQGEAPEEKLAKLERALTHYRLPLQDTVPLIAALLSLPVPAERYAPLTLPPPRQKQRTLDVLLAGTLERAAQHPVVVIVEDLHWVDPSTLEFLTLLIDQGPTAAVLTVLTCRPEFQPPWGLRSHLTQIALHRFAPAQAHLMITGVTGGKPLPPEVAEQVVAKTDGVPLFIEELTKMVLESGWVREEAAHYALMEPLPRLAIPATLYDSLMARLDRFTSAKAMAQLGATLGRAFAYDLLRAVVSIDEATLQHSLRQLVEAELLYQRGLPPRATYRFKHALLQEAAYQSLLRSTRQQYHQRIAQVLTEQFPESVATQPEVLAHHYTEAGLVAQAVGYWYRAGEQAAEHAAYAEAAIHFTRGLEGLRALPETPARHQQELTMLLALGRVVLATKGFAAPEAGEVYARARLLCQHVPESPQLAQALRGLTAVHDARGEHRTAREVGTHLLALAQRLDDPVALLEAHRALGVSTWRLGNLMASRDHLDHGIGLYNRLDHDMRAFFGPSDPGVACYYVAALVLQLLGYPDQALQRSQEALALAQARSVPFTRASLLIFLLFFHVVRREGALAQAYAEAVLDLSTEHGFLHFVAGGTMGQGAALVLQGQAHEGMAHLRQGLAAWQKIGMRVLHPWALAILAEAYGYLGQPEAGLSVLAEAQGITATTDERVYTAELMRLQGTLLLQAASQRSDALRGTAPTAAAETCLRQALDLGRAQHARWWELRTAISLAHLWQQQGKRAAANELLAPVYGWFTEGFDTADLRAAKTLLDTLH